MGYCVNCGALRHADHKFCGACGADLSGSIAARNAAPSTDRLQLIASEMESGLGEVLYRQVLSDKARVPATALPQKRRIRPWHKVWIWSVGLGAFAFGSPKLVPSKHPLEVFAASVLMGSIVFLIAFICGAAIILLRKPQPVSAYYPATRHSEHAGRKTVQGVCVTVGLLMIVSSALRFRVLQGENNLFGIAEGMAWLILACNSGFALRYAGIFALVTLTLAFVARVFGNGTSPAALAYALLFAAFFSLWVDGRFIRNYFLRNCRVVLKRSRRNKSVSSEMDAPSQA